MSQCSVTIHRVTGIRVEGPREGTIPSGAKYYAMDIIVKDDEGKEVVFTLFADTAEALSINGGGQ